MRSGYGHLRKFLGCEGKNLGGSMVQLQYIPLLSGGEIVEFFISRNLVTYWDLTFCDSSNTIIKERIKLVIDWTEEEFNEERIIMFIHS